MHAMAKVIHIWGECLGEGNLSNTPTKNISCADLPKSTQHEITNPEKVRPYVEKVAVNIQVVKSNKI